VTRRGGRDRRGPAGRGGVSPLPPLGPEVSPGSPGRAADGGRWPAVVPGGVLVCGRCAVDKRHASGRGADAVAGRAEAPGASIPSPRTPPPLRGPEVLPSSGRRGLLGPGQRKRGRIVRSAGTSQLQEVPSECQPCGGRPSPGTKVLDRWACGHLPAWPLLPSTIAAKWES
jgi:hypothetical protein